MNDAAIPHSMRSTTNDSGTLPNSFACAMRGLPVSPMCLSQMVF